MRIAVVDDQFVWRNKIHKYLGTIINEDDTIRMFTSGEEFLEMLEKYDIVFMDIKMGKMDGLKTTRLYKDKYPDVAVAFLTKHMELCTEGYKVNAFRFIDKRDMEDKIREALSAAQVILRNNKFIEINVLAKGKFDVEINNIIYIETMGRNILIHMREKNCLSTESMREMNDKLKKEGFFRCHQSFLVNLDDVESYNKEDVFLKNGEKVMLSKRQRGGFEEAFLKRTFRCPSVSK